MSAEGLQRGVDSGVCTQCSLVLIGKGFVFVHLWRRRKISTNIVLNKFHSFWHSAAIPIIIVRGDIKEVFSSCGGRSWWSWRAGWSGFTLWALTTKK